MLSDQHKVFSPSINTTHCLFNFPLSFSFSLSLSLKDIFPSLSLSKKSLSDGLQWRCWKDRIRLDRLVRRDAHRLCPDRVRRVARRGTGIPQGSRRRSGQRGDRRLEARRESGVRRETRRRRVRAHAGRNSEGKRRRWRRDQLRQGRAHGARVRDSTRRRRARVHVLQKP